MSFQSLSDVVRRILARSSAPPSSMGLRERGAMRAFEVWGPDAVLETPTMINCGALADELASRVVVHSLRPGVCQLVHDTDLRSLPSEPPRLLRGAWLLEARHASRGETLFGATASLGGYVLDDTIYLVGVQYPDGAYATGWRPRWEDGELPEGRVVERSPLVDEHDHASYSQWAREAARFALVAALLLESEDAPIHRDDERQPVGRASGGGAATEWVTRHVTLGPSSPREAASGGGLAGAREDDAALALVNVRGHLRRQRHGPGNAQTKWVYVAQYSARRWVAPRPLRIVVGTGDG